MMKTLLTIIISMVVFVAYAQDIPYMSGKIDYVKKGDYHLSDSSLHKALSSYEKGLKKRPDDSLLYVKRIAFVRTLLGDENSIARETSILLQDSAEVELKLALFDLETLELLEGGVQLKNSSSGEVVDADKEGFFSLIKGEKYDIKGGKEGYHSIDLSILAKENEDDILLATTKIQKYEIAKVQSGDGRINMFELSEEEFFESANHVEDTEDYFVQSIYFDFDKADLPENTDLSSIVALMKKYDHLKLEIRGFSDSRGASSYNKKLAINRIESVISKLVSLNISNQRLTLVPLGEENLVACKESEPCSESDHAQNRRVDFVLRSDFQNQRQLSMLDE